MTSDVMERPGAGGETVSMTVPHSAFGPALREFRRSRGLSQQGLADTAQVSTRHLSYLENGRSAPSRQMVLVLGSALDLPLRERNTLLTVAGFAPVYACASPTTPLPAALQSIVDHLFRAHEPFGAILVDRDWNVRQLNQGAQRIFAWAGEGLASPPEVLGNLVRSLLDPRGFRPRVVDWEDAARATVDRVRRALRHERDPGRRRFLGRLVADVELPPGGPASPGLPVLPLRLRRDDEEVALVTAITTLGTPLDVTAEELHIESYFPADARSEAFLRAL